jgi:hypothetical protein
MRNPPHEGFRFDLSFSSLFSKPSPGTAGINGENGGLFGSLAAAVPEPAPPAMFDLALSAWA